MNNTSLYNTMVMEDDDTSWSNINPDWSNFSFADELLAREITTNEVIQQLKETHLVPFKEYVDSIFDAELENFRIKYRNVKTENYDILKESEDIKRNCKELLENFKKLESSRAKLNDTKRNLESEISKLTSDHKNHKVAYKTALKHYENNFDFNVSIVETSDDIFVAHVTFKFAKFMEPIKVVVNRDQRKIIEIDTHGLMDTQNFEGTTIDPVFFCNLRQKVLDSVL